MSIENGWNEVVARVGAAARRAGRAPDEVEVVAVAKTFPIEAVRAALDAGAVHIGENRAQELAHKAAIVGRPVQWHFVGHLQTNKVRLVAGSAALVHSVDRLGLADALARRAAALGITQRVLVQVNVSGERAKHGVEPARALALAGEVDALNNVEVAGLMTMPPFAEDPQSSRPFFRDLAELGRALQEELPEARHLSMGMTRDFEVAVEEGATLVRIGEAIFGRRPRTLAK